MKPLENISELIEGSYITRIDGDNFWYYEYLSVYPRDNHYQLFIDNRSFDIICIHESKLLGGDYFIGKYDPIFVANKRIEYYERMIKVMRRRIEEYKNKRLIV